MRLFQLRFNLLLSTLFVVAAAGCSQLPSDTPLRPLVNGQQATHRSSHSGVERSPAYQQAFELARAAERAGKTDEAIERYTQLTDKYTKDAKSRHRLAVLLDKSGAERPSAPLYLAAMRLRPDDAEVLCDYGYSRYLQGDLVLAERTLRRAIELDPNLSRAHTNLALVLTRQGHDDLAQQAFQTAGQTPAQATSSLRRARTASRLSTITSRPNH